MYCNLYRVLRENCWPTVEQSEQPTHSLTRRVLTGRSQEDETKNRKSRAASQLCDTTVVLCGMPAERIPVVALRCPLDTLHSDPESPNCRTVCVSHSASFCKSLQRKIKHWGQFRIGTLCKSHTSDFSNMTYCTEMHPVD